MEKFEELSFEEMVNLEGGGPVRKWFCEKTKQFMEWWNSTPEAKVDLCADGNCVLV